MRRYIVWLLRAAILALLLLPVLLPSLEREKNEERLKPVVVLARRDLLKDVRTSLELEKRIREAFGGKRAIEVRVFGGSEVQPLLAFEELGAQLSSTRGIVVVLAEPWLWGPAARKFNTAIRQSRPFLEKELFWLDPARVGVNADAAGRDFLGINDLYLPTMSFLGEESKASIDIVGRMSPNATVVATVLLRVGESVLATATVDISANDQGVVNVPVEVSLSFVKPGTQVLTAQLNAEAAVEPLNLASTTVNVVHAKTTLLHIALGPDWSLRSFREKLKFWPNLDLVSYYILRDVTSDASIPNSQMSLIEFPSEKLFGEQLPSFHGVVVQNFPFSDYLNTMESRNLVKYVQEGGRLFVQGGPMSFASHDPAINSLFPCKNAPQFDFETVFRWEANTESLAGVGQFAAMLQGLESSVTALGCEPKPEALVLARTESGHHPTLLAMPVDKGLVVTALAGDWHTRFFQTPLESEADKAGRVSGAARVEGLFQWIIEFLQRRQDGGVRPPDLAGPRLFVGDKVVPVRSRGVARAQAPLALVSGNSVVARGRLGWLEFLGVEAAMLEKSLEGEVLVDEGLFALTSLRMDFARGGAPGRRSGLWPVHGGTSASRERFPNALLFADVPPLAPKRAAPAEAMARRSRELTPLIEVHPWLLALLLGLIALEQYLVHIRWRGRLDRDVWRNE